MKRLFSLFLAVLVLSFCTSFAQKAKKPRVMIVPSDALMAKLGLLEATDDAGDYNFYQHYKLAFLDDELKACIVKFEELMRDRGFPLTNLEMALKKAQDNPDYVLPIDIRIDLNYKMSKQGPRDILYAEFAGFDMTSFKNIASASGESSPAIGATAIALLQEAVIDKIDPFCSQLQQTFEEWATTGREGSLMIRDSQGRLDQEFGGQTLEELIESFLESNCVGSSFNVDNSEDEVFQASQIMMPLFDESGRAIDGRRFFKPLEKQLKNLGFKTKIRNIGGSIGQVEITLN